MSGSRLVVFGDTLLDSDVEGSVHRRCPDAPVPVVDVRAQHWRPGGAGLAALLAARAGHEVVLVTALGTEPAAQLLADLLAADVEVVRMPLLGATVCKTRIRAQGRSLLRIDTGDGRAAGAPTADRSRPCCATPRRYWSPTTGAASPPILASATHHRAGAPGAGGVGPASAGIPTRARVPRGDAQRGRGGKRCRCRSRGAPSAAALRGQWCCDAVAITLGARGAGLATAGGCTTVAVPEIEVPHDRRPLRCGRRLRCRRHRRSARRRPAAPPW